MHPQILAVPGLPPPHVFGVVHVPQLVIEPQLLVTLPQFFPAQLVATFIVHPQTLATLGVAPPQEEPVPVHVPQLATVRVSPQLSTPVTLPQFFPLDVQNAASD